MAKLVGLLILVICVAVVLNDWSRMRDERREAETRKRAIDEDPVRALSIVRGQNDPMITAWQSQAEMLSRIFGATVGGGVGAGAGRAAGAAISAAEVNLAYGLGSHTMSRAEAIELADRSHAASAGAGEAVGAQASGPGAAVGSGPIDFLGGLGGGFEDAVKRNARRYGWAGPQDVPILGAFFTASDRLTGRAP